MDLIEKEIKGLLLGENGNPVIEMNNAIQVMWPNSNSESINVVDESYDLANKINITGDVMFGEKAIVRCLWRTFYDGIPADEPLLIELYNGSWLKFVISNDIDSGLNLISWRDVRRLVKRSGLVLVPFDYSEDTHPLKFNL